MGLQVPGSLWPGSDSHSPNPLSPAYKRPRAGLWGLVSVLTSGQCRWPRPGAGGKER